MCWLYKQVLIKEKYGNVLFHGSKYGLSELTISGSRDNCDFGNGLLLAEYQGKLFEKSAELGCSTAIFLRRFLHSDLVKKLDMNDAASLSLDVNEGIYSIQNQFGESDYGKNKYSKSALFWIGYMYRYLSYTRGVTTKFIMNIFPYKQLNDVYYSFHTQDPEWCVQNLLEMNGLSEDIFDNNLRLKAVISARGEY